jgi:alpha-glucosidase
MDIQKIVYVIRAIGIPGIVRTIQYGFLRDRIEKQSSTQPSHQESQRPGNISTVTSIEGGLRAEYEHASIEIDFLTQKMIKVSWRPGKPPFPYTLTKTDWEVQKTEYKCIDSGHSLICGKVEASIDNIGGILFRDLDGNVLRKDNPPVREGNRWTLSTIMVPEEHVYGLGERAGALNLRPGSYCSWNTDVGGSYTRGNDPLYIGTPIYLSLSNSGSYLAYFENSYRSTFNIRDTFEASFSAGMLRYYIIFGSTKEIFSQLADLIGHSAMPPRWVLGYHQCRWGYRSEEDIRHVSKGFEEHNLPISAIHLDIDYMDNFRLFTINSKHFSNMKQLSTDLEAKGIKLVSSINPAVKVDHNYKVYQNGLSKEVFCKLPNGDLLRGVSWSGWSVFPDFSKAEARNWWKENYQYLIKEGISGFWHDMNEPSSFAGWGDKTLPVTTFHFMEGQGGDHFEVHNLYGLLMDKAGYEALHDYAPDKRPWILSRAGWAGMQKYAWIWTGDIESTWEALRQTIPMIIGLGLSGHAFSGVDIGGFSGSPTGELYLRWFQMATFLPFFRTHSAIGTKPREPWVFGEQITDIIRVFLKLRYKLLPYLYTLSWQSCSTGFPAVRPLFWEDPQDHKLWDVEDEFFLGDSLLIAPIMEENVHNRQITLPVGIWYSYWDDQQYIGPTRFDYPTSVESIPIFIKGGTLLTMEEAGEITFHIYPSNGDESSSQLYNDSGDGYGSWRLDTFHLASMSNSLEIHWDTLGDHPFPCQMVRIQVHGKKLVKADFDGVTFPIQDNSTVCPIFQIGYFEFV